MGPTPVTYPATGPSREADAEVGEFAAPASALGALLAAQEANLRLGDGRTLARLGTQIAAACAREQVSCLWAATDAGHRLLAAALVAAPDSLAAHHLGDVEAAVAIIEAVTVTPLGLDHAAALLKRTGVDRVHAIAIEVYTELPTLHLDTVVVLGQPPTLRRAR